MLDRIQKQDPLLDIGRQKQQVQNLVNAVRRHMPQSCEIKDCQTRLLAQQSIQFNGECHMARDPGQFRFRRFWFLRQTQVWQSIPNLSVRGRGPPPS